MSAPLDFPQFVAAVKQFRREGLRLAVKLLSLLFVFFGLLYWGAFVFGIPDEPPNVMTPKRTAWLAVLVVGTFGIIIYMGFRLERLSARPGTTCPHCSTPLLSGHGMSLAIATKHCPRCHKPLFERLATEDGSTVDVAATLGENSRSLLMTREQLRTADATCRRAFFKYMAVASALAVMYGTASGIIVFLFRQRIEEAAGEVWGPVFKVLLVFPSFVLLMWGIPVALHKSERAHGPRCPGCQEQLDHRALVLVSGACGHCGQRVLSDTLPLVPFAKDTELPSLLMDRRRFLDQSRKLHRRMPLCCLAGGAVGFGWFGVVCASAHFLRTNWGWPNKENPVVVVLMFLAVVLQLVTVFVVSTRLERRLTCPHCRESLLHGRRLVLATGCCTNCGRQVLRAETSGNSEPT